VRGGESSPIILSQGKILEGDGKDHSILKGKLISYKKQELEKEKKDSRQTAEKAHDLLNGGRLHSPQYKCSSEAGGCGGLENRRRELRHKNEGQLSGHTVPGFLRSRRDRCSLGGEKPPASLRYFEKHGKKS